MPAISSLSPKDQRTVRRLWKGKSIRIDNITGMMDRIKSDFYQDHPSAVDGNDWKMPTYTINGEKPLGALLPLQSSRTIVNDVTGEDRYQEDLGNHRVVVNIGNRNAGTRVGIHVHESGGATFVMKGKGEITDFVEGYPNSVNPKGDFYYMPSDIQMSASNLTDKNVWLMDVFVTETPQSPEITIIEPGYSGYKNPITTADVIDASKSYSFGGSDVRVKTNKKGKMIFSYDVQDSSAVTSHGEKPGSTSSVLPMKKFERRFKKMFGADEPKASLIHWQDGEFNNAFCEIESIKLKNDRYLIKADVLSMEMPEGGSMPDFIERVSFVVN